MYTVAIISEKGGVGKTTLATNLAGTAMLRGQLAALVDIDPSAGASDWGDRRLHDDLLVIASLASELPVAIREARKQGIQFVVIDTAPKSAEDARVAAKRADLIVIPVEPSVLSLRTVGKAGQFLRLAGNPPAIFVINKAPTAGTARTAAAVEYISGQGFVVCPVVLHHRAVYRDATDVGKVAAEVDANSKGAAELFDFYNYVLLALNQGREKNGKA